MQNFGYNIVKPRVIDHDKNDSRLLNYVLEHEPSFMICLSCGGCTATCSAGNLTDFNIRKMSMLLRRGETENLEKEVNKCMLCGKCRLVCPRGINTRHVVMLIKKSVTMFK